MLEGADVLIRRDRPIISVEFGYPSYSVYGRNATELFELAQRWGYTLTDLLGNPFGDLDGWMACVDTYYWDLLVIPDECLFETWMLLCEDVWPLPK